MNIAAGIFLVLFGGFGTWLLRSRFPAARFLPASYALMMLGGVVFMLWTLVHAVAFAIAGAVVLVLAGVLGLIGAARKEVRVAPPF